MASFSNFVPFLFLTSLLLSLQIDARDSQFFSKVTPFNNNNNVKETEFPNKEEPLNKPEQQPVFTPETADNSYGLYGHDSSQFPSTTTATKAERYTTPTTTYEPYNTEFEDTSKYPNKKHYNKDSYNNNYYNKNAYAYGGNQNELSDTKYTEGGSYNSMANQNNNHNYFYDNNNNVAHDNRYSYNTNAANNRYNGERQGMSDTRFLEGGKYFYDVQYEKYNPTFYGDSSRGVNTNHWHHNRGYYGNNKFTNSYESKNSMEGYQNQDEFEEDQEEFEP